MMGAVGIKLARYPGRDQTPRQPSLPRLFLQEVGERWVEMYDKVTILGRT